MVERLNSSIIALENYKNVVVILLDGLYCFSCGTYKDEMIIPLIIVEKE